MFLLLLSSACGLFRSPGVADWELGRTKSQGALDLPGAAAAFERACAAGHLQACGELGLLLQDGRGVPHDPARAQTLYQQACDGGLGVACFNLALMLDGGVWAEIDTARAAALFTRAEGLYREACDGGDLQWCPNLGTLYESGLGVPVDPEAAAAIYRSACDRGHPVSCANLGLMLREDGGDPAEARALLERSCTDATPLGCGFLGQVLVQDGANAPPSDATSADLTRGVSLLEAACERGERDPCGILAGVWGIGLGVTVDLARASAYEARACDLGATTACRIEAEVSAKTDPVRSRTFAEKGCFVGDGDLCGWAGAWTAAGNGGPQDPIRALELFRAGCRMGSVGACAELLFRNEPLPLPPDREALILRSACAGGVAEACQRLP